jgi:hypothetical protein
MPRHTPTASERENMIEAAIMRLTNGQAELMQARYDGSRAGLTSYEEDRAALRGIGLVTSRETRYSERWKPTDKEARFPANAVDHALPATHRGQYVKVTDVTGAVVYRTANSFRKTRTSNRRAPVNHNPAHLDRTRRTHTINASELSAIGDSNH